MSLLDHSEQSVAYLSVFLFLVLLVRLTASKLVRQYPFFSGFIFVSFIQALTALWLTPNTTLYAQVYFVSEPVIWLFFFLVVIELYRQILKDYPSIATIGRRILQGSFATALTVSFLTVLSGTQTSGHYPVLEAYLLADRTVVLFVLFFMLLLLGLLFRYPISVRRNTILCFIGYSVLFVPKMIELIAATQLEGKSVQVISTASQAIACACLLFWIIALNRKGEERELAVMPPWRGGEQGRLLEQLRSLNQALTNLNQKKSF